MAYQICIFNLTLISIMALVAMPVETLASGLAVGLPLLPAPAFFSPLNLARSNPRAALAPAA